MTVLDDARCALDVFGAQLRLAGASLSFAKLLKDLVGDSCKFKITTQGLVLLRVVQ